LHRLKENAMKRSLCLILVAGIISGGNSLTTLTFLLK
jgi:hypothetical protein